MSQAASTNTGPVSPEIEELRARLREAEETLDAIRNGDVDAVVVGGPAGQQVYTLENADRPYRTLIEQMQEGAITLSIDGIILYCNDRFGAIADVAREEITGKSIHQFFDGDQYRMFQQLLLDSHQHRASAELTLTSARGTKVPVNISLIDLNIEEDVGQVICGVVTDLTMIRRRTDELASANASLANEIEERRRAQGSLQMALDAAGMGSWDLDLKLGTARRSLRHDQIFGHPDPLPSWTLETILEHFIPEDREIAAEAFQSCQVSGTLDFEARITRANDGLERWLRVTGRAYYDDAKPVRIAGVVVDVTERRVAEERLRQAQKIEAIGQLTGGVAHDFNNLLMAISGGLDMVDRQTDAGRRERILAGMRQAVERGSGLSRQLLAFSRRQVLQPEPVHLSRQVQGMRELLDRSLRGDVNVRTEFPDDLWPVEVDAGELELSVLNLALNARDAMPSGGVIVIRARNAPDIADSELKGDFVRLSVIDGGTGIEPELLARVFEPYFTTKEVGKGSGLGLAQTHGFARASGGAVRIQSEMGVGTEVTLLLPRSFKVPKASDEPVKFSVPERAPVAGSAGQVLLVEDDNYVAALTEDLLGQLGYRITRVASAEAALGALADDRLIDIVFSDVMMPGKMNGVDLAHELRVRRPDLPVLLTSGYAEAAKKGAEAEGVSILPKPYRLEDLAKAFELARAKTIP